MVSTSKATVATELNTAALVDGENADASDVLVPFGEAETNIDEARQTVSVSAGDSHVKHLEDALSAGTGVSLSKVNTGLDEQIQIAVNPASIDGLDASAIDTGTLPHERGGLEADVSAYDGLLKISGGATAQATPDTDYVTPSGAGTLANKTLTTPTIADFSNAPHDHSNAAGGGQIGTGGITSGAAASGYVLTANGAGGVSWAAVGGGGAAPIDIAVTAGEVLSERDAVYVDTATGTAKKIDIDANPPLVGGIRGIVNESGGIGNGASGTVRIAGEVSGYVGLSVWGNVYASVTAGGLTQTKPNPSHGGGQVAVVPMGYAVSDSAVMVRPMSVHYLKRETLASGGSTTVTHHVDVQGRERRVSAYVAATSSADATGYSSGNQDVDVLLGSVGAVLTYTTDLCAGGTASASSEQHPASNAFNDDTATYWQANANNIGYLQYDFGAGNEKNILKMTLTAHDVYFLYSPANFTIEASQDSSSWTVLSTQTSLSWVASEVKTFTFENDVDYRYYRLNITESVNGLTPLIAEVEMMEGATFGAGNSKLAQSFTLADATTVNSVALYLKKVGSPAGTLTVRIETDSAGEPSGTLAHANATGTLNEADLGTTYALETVDYTDFTLAAGTYWLVLSTSRSDSATDYVAWGADGSSPSYAGGEMMSEVSSVWSAENKDAVFAVYQPTTTNDEPCVVGRWSGGVRDVGVRFDDGSGADADTKTTFKNTSGGSLDVTVRVEVD